MSSLSFATRIVIGTLFVAGSMGGIARASTVVSQGSYVNGGTKYVNGRKIAFDGKGRLHAVFTQKVAGLAGNPGSYAYSDDRGATWNVTLNDLDQGTSENPEWGNFTPAIAVGSDDSVHVVWYAAHKEARFKAIFYAVSRDRGASWSKPVSITEGMAPSVYTWPSIALDRNDTPHVVFSDSQGTKRAFHAMLGSDGKWTMPQSISGGSTPKDVVGIEYNPHLGPNGALFVFFDTAGMLGNVKVNRSDDLGSSWIGLSTPATTGGRALWPSMTFDTKGNTYLTMTLNSGSAFKIWLLKRDPQGNWSKSNVDNLFPPERVKGYMRSSLTIDGSDMLHVFCEGSPESRANWDIWHTSASLSNIDVWEAPRRISDRANGDNAFVSTPPHTRGLDYVPVLWSHGDLADSETGHMSGALPRNGQGSVMFTAF